MKDLDAIRNELATLAFRESRMKRMTDLCDAVAELVKNSGVSDLEAVGVLLNVAVSKAGVRKASHTSWDELKCHLLKRLASAFDAMKQAIEERRPGA